MPAQGNSRLRAARLTRCSPFNLALQGDKGPSFSRERVKGETTMCTLFTKERDILFTERRPARRRPLLPLTEAVPRCGREPTGARQELAGTTPETHQRVRRFVGGSPDSVEPTLGIHRGLPDAL